MTHDEQTSAERRQIKVFISYRRGDSDNNAQSICDAFVARFGEKCVFFDVDQGPGEFAENIKECIKRADVLVAIIGPCWVELRRPPEGGTDSNSEDAVRWHEEDFVRWELKLALERKVELVPVFVDGVQDIPEATKMPEELRPLKRWSGYPLVSRSNGVVPYKQGLDHICNMVELAARKRRDRDLKNQVVRLAEMARGLLKEGVNEPIRVLLERARAAAEDIEDEMLREDALEELEPELMEVVRDKVTAGKDRDRETLSRVRRLLSAAGELVDAGSAAEARQTLASAEGAAHRIEDAELQKDAFSDLAELERRLTAGEGRLRELAERARQQAQAGQIGDARATAAFADETAQGIESTTGREQARSEVAELAEEIRAWGEAAARGDFSAAEEIVGSSGTATGRNTAATKEPGEPDHAGNAG